MTYRSKAVVIIIVNRLSYYQKHSKFKNKTSLRNRLSNSKENKLTARLQADKIILNYPSNSNLIDQH